MDTGVERQSVLESEFLAEKTPPLATKPFLSSGFKIALAIVAICYLYANAAIEPVFLAGPPSDEITWAKRSLATLTYRPPVDQPMTGDGERATPMPVDYYYAIHHPTITRIIYGAALAVEGSTEIATEDFDYNLDNWSNQKLGRLLQYDVRTALRLTNALFVLAAVLLLFAGMLRLSGSPLLSALATLPVIYEPTIIAQENCAIANIGADAILLFMLVAFWYLWLVVKNRSTLAIVALGVMAGLATSTKYNASLALIGALVYYAVVAKGWRKLLWPLMMGAIAVAVFVALNPIYWGGPSWMWKVFHDTLSIIYQMQYHVISSSLNSRWLVSDRLELALMLFPYLPFIVPIAALFLKARREPWFGPTMFWGMALLLGGLGGLVLFLPTYAVPGRVAFVVMLMAAGIAALKGLRDKDLSEPNGASQQAAGEAEISEAKRGVPTGLLFVPVIALAGLFAYHVPVAVFAAAAVALVLVCVSMILGHGLKATVVVLPVALMVPWRHVAEFREMVAFSLAVVVAWALWLYLKRVQPKRPSVVLVAIAATAALSVSREALVCYVLVALAYLWRPGNKARWGVAAALVAPAAFIAYFGWLLGSAFSGDLATPVLAGWLDLAREPLWTSPGWSNSVHSVPYVRAMNLFNQPFHLALIVPLALLAYPWRREWWFAGTFAGAALVFAGAMVFPLTPYFQYSMPMELALLVPLGMAGVLALGRERRCTK